MWPFTSSYPERAASEVHGKTFDYIVVGGGTAGCVLASRLSEDPDVSVLLLEKGAVDDHYLSRMPLLSQNYYLSALKVLVRESEPVAPPATGDGNRCTTQPNASSSRRLKVRTREALGGATRINAMLHTRGVPGGYNEWAEMGHADWSWERVEPYFIKSETAVHLPDAKYRGHHGPLVNRRLPTPFTHFRHWESAASSLGLPVVPDANDPSAPAMGFCHLDLLVDARGERASAYNTFLPGAAARARRPKGAGQPGLTVCTRVVASKLQLSAGADVVTGVHIKTVSRGPLYFVAARREVIVTCGAVGTPQLLLMSGIGPRAPLVARGIDPIVELDGVGKHLTDHSAVPLLFTVPLWETFHWMEFFLSFVAVWHLLLYALFRTGIFASPSTPHTIFVRSATLDRRRGFVPPPPTEAPGIYDASLPANAPDLELMLQPCSSFEGVEGVVSRGPWWDLLGRRTLGVWSLHLALVQPRARGRVELASKTDGRDPTDPETQPIITYPAPWQDSEDAAALRKGVRFALTLAEEFATKSGYPWARSVRPYLVPGTDGRNARERMDVPVDAAVELGRGSTFSSFPKAGDDTSNPAGNSWSAFQPTDRQIDRFVSSAAVSAMHLTSTCRMGLRSTGGVVDDKLRVHGVVNLRIADASVFPKIPSAHTMAPTVMVAERCAEFVKRQRKGGRKESSQ